MALTAPSVAALDCPVCLDMYRDPRMLPACGHSICSGCVQQIVANTTSVGNVVCPECRGLSPVTPAGFPKNYKLEVEIVSSVETAGYRQTSQCCGCRAQVPNRRLHWCLTCATEDAVTLCADCALLCHKDHYLTPFMDTSGTHAAAIQSSTTARSPTAVVVDISEIRLLTDASEQKAQGNRTIQSSIPTGASRPGRCARCCGALKTMVLALIKLILILLGILGFITTVGFVALICFALFGPLGVVMLLSLILVPIEIAAEH